MKIRILTGLRLIGIAVSFAIIAYPASKYMDWKERKIRRERKKEQIIKDVLES